MQSSLFLPTKETWQTSLRENKPVVFIFLDLLCPFCFEFDKLVLSDPDVQKYLFQNFIPLFLNIQLHPDLFERFNSDNYLAHCARTVSGNLIGSCDDPSPSHFLRNLQQYKQL